jgi:hypothetical protein
MNMRFVMFSDIVATSYCSENVRPTLHAPDRLDQADFPPWQRVNAFLAVSHFLASRRVM